MAKKNTVEFVLRPFEGLPGEPDWVALREVVPSATAAVRTTAEHGARDVLVTTVLPMSWLALHRTDGTVLLALQTSARSGDSSRDLAAVLLQALELEPGTPVQSADSPAPGPRLQDVLDPAVPFEVTVHDGFDHWLDPAEPRTSEIDASLEEAAESLHPTVKLSGVQSAYLTTMGSRRYLRWAQPHDEDSLIDAIARLHARRESALGGARFLGAFRSSGLVVPVWDVQSEASVEDVEAAAVEFGARLDAALAESGPLTSDERRARAGIVSRQLTLR